jgi:hypothetical protein
MLTRLSKFSNLNYMNKQRILNGNDSDSVQEEPGLSLGRGNTIANI